MLEIYQKTLSENVTFKGIGLHTGKSSTITVMPGKENEGIKFKRVDLNKNNIISANFKNVSSARLCTHYKTILSKSFNCRTLISCILYSWYRQCNC